GSALPGERRTNNRVKIGMPRLPLEAAPGESGVGDELGRIALPPCGLAEWHRAASDPFDSRDDLTHRTALPGAQIERTALAPPGEMAKRPHMRIREVAHVDVVADRAAVRRRVIRAVDFNRLTGPKGGAQHPRDQVSFGLVVFADFTRGIGAGGVEITQRGKAQAVA